MKTTTRFLFAVSIRAIAVLAMALTLNACSNDDSTPAPNTNHQFGTCDEAIAAMGECQAIVMQSSEFVTYMNCIIACVGSEDTDSCEDTCEGIIEPIVEQCILSSGICGNASAEECGDHFDNECDFDGEALLKR